MIIEFRNSLYKNNDIVLNDNAVLGYFNLIVLRPNEFYCQKLPFFTDNEYNVFIADLCGNNLEEITENSFFSFDYIEFSAAGGVDFYGQNVIIKIVNNVNPTDVWYSNPILITDEFYSKDIVYKNISDNYFQRAGLNAYFTRAIQESEVKSYVQESGNKVTGKSTFTEFRKYFFELIDNFNYRNINKALANSNVYLENLRVTDKPLLKDSDILGHTNIFNSELTASVNYNDVFEYKFQNAEPLNVINYYPNSIYTLSNIENRVTLIFNHEVNSTSTSIIKLFKDGLFYSNLDLIQISSNTFEQVFNFTENGEYRDWETDRKSTRLNSSHSAKTRMPSSA